MPFSYKYLVTVPDEWNVTNKKLDSEFETAEEAFQFCVKLLPYCQPLIIEMPVREFLAN